MVNINPTDPLTLDRENLEAIDQSTIRQWTLIGHLLGLPTLRNLNTVDEVDVAERIANHINTARGGVESISELRDLLVGHYRTEEEIALQAAPEESTARRGRTANVEIADAWLKTIFTHFSENDIRQMTEHLTRIRLANNSTVFTGNVNIGGAMRTMLVDFNHQIWTLGSSQEVRQQLTNQVPRNVGITTAYGNPLTTPDVDNILAINIQIVDPQTARPRMVQLREALDAHASIRSLCATSVNARELMLALATAHRDPLVLRVFNEGSNELQKTRNDIVANNLRLNAAQAVQILKEGVPQQSEVDITNGISAMQKIIQNLGVGSGLNSGEVIDLYTGAVGGRPTAPGTLLDPAEQAEAIRARMPNTITRLVVLNVRGEVQRDNSDQFNRIAEQAQNVMTKLDQERAKIEKIENALNAMAALLEAQGITNAQLSTYTALNTYIDTGSTPYRALRGAIGPSMNVGQLDQEFRRALLQANPDRSLALQSFETYDNKGRQLGTKLEELTNNPDILTGSDACWKIVERGLEHQGIRGKELENTLSYMRAQVQRTPESIRDRSILAEAEFSYDGEENSLAAAQYNEGKSHRQFRKFLLGSNNPYRDYVRNLFTQENIGLRLTDNPSERRFPTSRLLDAYFRTKYLMSLGISDTKALPQSREIVQFMRRLHEAILDRMQESFNYASGMNPTERQELRARGMDIDPQHLREMGATERMQFIQEYLHDPAPYVAKNKRTIEAIANRAYRPIQQNKEGYETDLWWTKKIAWWSTLGVPVFAAKNIVAPIARGTYNKALKPLWNNKGSMALGAVAGTFFMPVVGTAIGAAVGPWVKKKFFATK